MAVARRRYFTCWFPAELDPGPVILVLVSGLAEAALNRYGRPVMTLARFNGAVLEA